MSIKYQKRVPKHIYLMVRTGMESMYQIEKIIDGIITHILIYSTILIGYYNIYSLNKIILR